MLTHNLLVTSGRDSLLVWDARLSDPVKEIRVGDAIDAAGDAGLGRQRAVTLMTHLAEDDSVACNYGRRIRLVHFPLLSDKKE